MPVYDLKAIRQRMVNEKYRVDINTRRKLNKMKQILPPATIDK